jgi:DNA (cytosine-5)-methyltransferase 1
MTNSKISAIDLFCGIGGISYGFQKAGVEIKAGIDFDKNCKYAFEENCNAPFIHADISKVNGSDLTNIFGDSEIKVLVGCAPCQPFSTYNYKMDQQKGILHISVYTLLFLG